ncbi:hypothetical protein R6Q57_001783 [Mikania cordata]
MSYDDYSPAPFSGSFERSTSIDYSMPSSYATNETSPNMSSVVVGNTEHQPPEYGQRTVADDPADALPPVLSDVRPAVYSGNQITNRSWDPNGDQPAQGYSGLLHNNNSGCAGNLTADGNGEAQPPSFSGAGQRDRSNNGVSGDIDTVDPMDYAGISLVGKRFKLVNPDAYYVEKDESPPDFP